MSLTVDDLADRYQYLVAPDDNDKFYRLVNEAEARLQETAKWHWTKTEVTLAVTDGAVYLDPELYASLLGVIVDDDGRVIRQREIEFAPGGNGRTEAGEAGLGYLIDCGIVLYDDGGSGDPVRRRKYKICDIVTDTSVPCLVHLAHVKLEDAFDYLACPSARAMKLAMFACVYEEANDMERAKIYWADSYTALSEDEATKRGSTRASVPIQPFGDGIDPIGGLM